MARSCLAFCPHFIGVTFETRSRAERIEDECFDHSELKSICIPPSVQHVGKSAFSRLKFEQFMFQQDSEVAEIDDECFCQTSFKSLWP
jgi:hypothetical protein